MLGVFKEPTSHNALRNTQRVLVDNYLSRLIMYAFVDCGHLLVDGTLFNVVRGGLLLPSFLQSTVNVDLRIQVDFYLCLRSKPNP